MPSESDYDGLFDVADEGMDAIDNIIWHWYFDPTMMMNESTGI